MAEDDPNASSQHIQLRQNNKGATNNPRTPIVDFIYCEYSSGYIELDLQLFSAAVEVSIYNNDMPIWYGILNAEDNSAEIPVLYGSYTIICTTNDGKEYSGVLYF